MTDDDFKLVPPDPDGSSKNSGRTPMMQQYLEAKAQEPEALLLFRMGDFYEMFYEDAVVGAEILEIALTTRDKKSDNPIPMCGVPFHALENYIGKLIEAGHRVAICDQVEDPKEAKGLVKRAITRVVTPGTLLEENLLRPRENNYLCAIVERKSHVAAALIDLSTGDFKVVGHGGNQRWTKLAEDVALLHPREIIHPEEQELPEALINLAGDTMIHGQEDWWFGIDVATGELKKHFGVATLDAFGLETAAMISSAGGALQYLREVQKAELAHLRDVEVIRSADAMIIDEVSRRNLELTESYMTSERKDSLLGLIDKTTTSMGARLIRQWLLRPLIDTDAIHARLNAVEELLGDNVGRSKIEGLLKGVSDMERLMTRISLGSANARDLVSLRRSIEAIPPLLQQLERFSSEMLTSLAASMDLLEDVQGDIATTLVEEPPLALRDGGLIRDGADEELDELRAIVADNKQFIRDFERQERNRTGINNLKVKYNKVFGYYIEVSRGNLDLVPEDYFRKQTLVNAERFITPELKEFESKVLNAQDRIVTLEFDMFTALRSRIAEHHARIARTARAIGCLDVLRCLAENAASYSYRRPKVHTGGEISIVEGRHPVVERLRIEERFIPNDTLVDTRANRLLIITGPNMGGKSTYLRQVALITILAQMGSFVPAKEANIGVVDRIFTRIGASDHLARGHSTFMVEMSETANILRNATSRSLIILDEVGRGTSTFDGLSIAWSVAEHIHSAPELGAKTLFATHYHELTELAATLEGVKNYNVTARETDEGVIFLRTVAEGPSDQSYGIQVARLAGLPDGVIRRAREILENLEREAWDTDGTPRLAKHNDVKEAAGNYKADQAEDTQRTLIREIAELEIEKMTPVEAINCLERLKKKLSE